MKLKLSLALFFSLLFVSTAFAKDVIKLKNGKILEGNIAAWGTGQTQVLFQTEGAKEPEWISVVDIDTIQFNAPVIAS
jgi:hypothetical protein